MNIKRIDEFTLDIYVKKELLNNIKLNTKDNLESYLKSLFKTLKDYYNIKIEGFYEITVYLDKYYGVVFHLEKEDLEYYSYFKNQVDMKVTTVNTEFMYLVEDIPFSILDKFSISIKDNNIYLKIVKELNKLEMMNLLENSTILYEFS